MSIYDSDIWISDIDSIIEELPEINMLSGKRIMITGCTGLICSALVDVLIRWNETHNEKITIIAAGRNEEKVKNRFSHYADKEWFLFIPYDATSTANCFVSPCDYIIHGASNASPNKIVKEPVETMMSNFIGMKCLLDYAYKHGIKRVLYISSSEVYGKKDNNNPFKTTEYGYIDVLNARNSYSISKRAAETLCVSYADEYGVESVIIRPGHIYGPTALESDNRVSSTWAYAVAGGDNIVMKSDGAQIRSYCYCLDSASAIIKVLIAGEPNHAYNISNPKSIMSIREIAEIMSNAANKELIVEKPTEAEQKGFNPMSNSSLDSEELMKLGWRGLFDAEQGFSHTVEILKRITNQ